MSDRKAIAYIRVSTRESDGTTEQQNGLDAQLSQIRDYAKHRRLELVSYYQDLCSGASPLSKRPGLTEAIAQAKEHGAKFLIIQRRDRLARDMSVALSIESMLHKRKVRILTVLEDPDEAASPERTLMTQIQDIMASYERQLISARVKAALKIKSERGEALGAVPYAHTHAGRHAVAVFEGMRSKGWTWEQIAEWANRERIRPMRLQLWTVRAVRDAVYFSRKHPAEKFPIRKNRGDVFVTEGLDEFWKRESGA